MEPGNGSQEEQISFTGVTQNSNGTATLTGVKSVLFTSPYTETSGITKTHAGSTTVILSNDAGFYGQILDYIDTAIVSGGVPATTSVTGLTRISVAAASAATPISVGDNDPRMQYVAAIRNTGISYAIATGTATALTATLGTSISTLASGSFLNILVPTTNASGVTLNVNGLGAKTIRKSFSTSLASGEMVGGQVASLVYNGTSFQLISPDSSLTPKVTSYTSGTATWTKPAGLKYIVVEVQAGGGGSGSSGAGANNASAGAGAGGYSRKKINAVTLGSTETVTVGSGGGGGSTSDGSDGGNSSFGSHATATGGSKSVRGAGFGGAGGTASNGDVNISGNAGSEQIAAIAGGISGIGGSSILGFGGQPSKGAGKTGSGYGGGAGGAFQDGSEEGGASGGNGIVIVTEFYN
jgi:hypothetical protein